MLNSCHVALRLAEQLLNLDSIVKLSVVIKINLRVLSFANDHWFPQLLLALSKALHIFLRVVSRCLSHFLVMSLELDLNRLHLYFCARHWLIALAHGIDLSLLVLVAGVRHLLELFRLPHELPLDEL